MNDPNHLFEADKHRISNEAKVRTALEDPGFAQREFEKWRAAKEHQLEREKEQHYLSNAWAKVVWLAEGRMLAMGRELAKAQQRIGRQRKANRKAKERIEHLKGLLREVRPHIGDECQRIWPDDPEFEDMLVRLDAVLSPAKAREGEDVGNRPN